jgi:hypothetical protein
MSAARPTTTLSAVHDAIIDALQARFGARVRQFGAYEPWDYDTESADPDLRTPALLIELESIGPDGDDIHTPGRVALRCNWAIHAALSIRTEKLQTELREFAAAVVTTLRRSDPSAPLTPTNGNRWGLGKAVGAPEGVSAQPGEFRPGLNGRDSWLITWDQIVYVDDELPA